jgi:putative membrane protein
MPPNLKDFFQRWIITTVAVLVATFVVPGISYEKGNWLALLVATLLLGLLNVFVRPILLLLSLPFLIVTLGLFTLVINAVLLYFVGRLMKPSFLVEGFAAAFWGGVVISLVSLLLNSLTGTGNARISIKRGGARHPKKKNGGGGPVIDVRLRAA